MRPTSTPRAFGLLALRLLALAAVAMLLSAAAVRAEDAASSAGAAIAADYRIGVDDVLSVFIWESKDLDQVVSVRPDGKISLQLLGDVQAAGLRVPELRAELQKRYAALIEDARVSLNVSEIRSRSVFFVGQLSKAGPLLLTRPIRLLQAVAMAGGFAADADLETAFVLRAEEVIPVDFRALMRRPDPASNIEVLPGDTIVVPPAETVYVQGEVKNPGLLRFSGDLTVLKAIAEAGGLTDLARAGRVYVLRGRGPQKQRIEADVSAMLEGGKSVADLPLQPDDILTVPQRLF